MDKGNCGLITLPWFKCFREGTRTISSQYSFKSSLFCEVTKTVLAFLLCASFKKYKTSVVSPLMLSPTTKLFALWNTARIFIWSVSVIESMFTPILINLVSISFAASPDEPLPHTKTFWATFKYSMTLFIWFSSIREYVLFKSSW